jgi:phosphatidylserine decarboxylase
MNPTDVARPVDRRVSRGWLARLFCRNERAVVRARLSASGQPIALVPVAAILVASIRLHFLDVLLHLRRRRPNEMPCQAALAKGDEMGWFEHGSTIIVLAPPGCRLADGIAPGTLLKAGHALMELPVGHADVISHPHDVSPSLGVLHGPAKSQEQRARLTVGFNFLL